MKKEYTVNIDVGVFAENEVEAISKIGTVLHKAKLQYWTGDIREEIDLTKIGEKSND
jgi:hypothetical protein